jgi:Flp pilus assembly protein TadG
VRAADDEGAAVVDFVLVSVLVLALFLLVLQVAVFFHVRNVVTSAAAEGARYGATADRTPEEGAARAEESIRSSLGSRAAGRIHCRPALVDVQGAVVVEIACSGAVPVVFLTTPAVTLDVKGHALEESR